MNRFANAALVVAAVSAAIASPPLDHSKTSVMADGRGSHTVTTNQTGTTTQSGIAGSSGHTTVDRLDGPPVTISGRLDPDTGQATGHFVNTVFGDICNGQCG
jgi:hypothetical protein